MTDIQQTLIDQGALFVASHSGGKDSQAMLIALAKRVPASQILVVHATLGDIEWKGALEHAQQQAADLKAAFLVAKANWLDGSEKTLLGMVERRKVDKPNAPSWPSQNARYCTSDLKTGPIEREVRRFVKNSGNPAFKQIVMVDGIRAAESTQRSKYKDWEPHVEMSKAGRKVWVWRPIFRLSTKDVFDAIREAGQKPHWAYEAGNERLSCVFCVFGSKGDLANGARHNPELFKRYTDLEQKTGYTFHAYDRRPLAELVKDGEAELAQPKKTNLLNRRPQFVEPCSLAA